ncbi:NUDIX hydrolase [Candidatus Saccharibacteria bacterium]|nr:NUDIX hydrolase [Candidatus Saccharibacteria bacterium]
MQDRRSVKLLIRNGEGEFLVLRRSSEYPELTGTFDLPGGMTEPGERDLAALDRKLAQEIGLVLNTEDAVHIGYDAEYEPGEGMMTRVLYMLKLETSRPLLHLSPAHAGFDWVDKETLRGFEPPFQVLVRTALDFYL